MAQQEAAPIPTNRDEYVAHASADLRVMAGHACIAAETYHDIQSSDDAEVVRGAATWLAWAGGLNLWRRTPHSGVPVLPSVRSNIALNDPDAVRDSIIDLIGTAKHNLDEAHRVEEWAGHIFDNKHIVRALENSTLRGHVPSDLIEKPKRMLEFEDDTEIKKTELEVLKAKRDDVAAKLENMEDLDLIDLSKSVQLIADRLHEHSHNITLLDLADVQKQMLDGDASSAETALQTKLDIIEAIRTGTVSDDLRPAILEGFNNLKPPRRPNENLDDKPVEDLEFSVRTRSALKKCGINSVGDLVYTSKDELKVQTTLKPRHLEEIIETLHLRGLALLNLDDGLPTDH